MSLMGLQPASDAVEDGPLRTLATRSNAAARLHQTGHSCIARRFVKRMTAARTSGHSPQVRKYLCK